MTTVSGAATTTTTASAGSSDTKAATKALNQNYADFLKLLTTQLQNQDPTSPADTNQLTMQIASLNQVQQQININENLKQLISLYGANQNTNAVSYIGKQVEAEGSKGVLIGPEDNQQAAFVYNLPAGASKVTVSVLDSTGSEIFSADGTTLAGRNQVIWNGKNNKTGNQMPNGAYSFKVKALDSSNKEITEGVTTSTTGIVTSVDTQNGESALEIGGISVPVSKIISVRNPGA